MPLLHFSSMVDKANSKEIDKIAKCINQGSMEW